MYFGLLLGIPFGFFLTTFPHLPPTWMAVVMLFGIAPMGIDGFTQLKGWRMSTNGIRLATGLIAGIVLAGVWVEMILYGISLAQ